MTLVERHLGHETDPVVFDGVLRRLTRLVLPQWTVTGRPRSQPSARSPTVCAEALAAGDAARGLASMRRLGAC